MGRRKKKEIQVSTAWLLTFSDLTTLLLTFFVLLISMSSMDVTLLTRISAQMRSLSHIPLSGPGKLKGRIEIVAGLIRDPANLLENRNRLRDLLFPYDTLPPDLSHSELDKNLKILQHPEGVVIVLTEGILFAPGSSIPNPTGKKLLDALVPVLHAVNAPANISGHASPDEGAGEQLYKLSFMRGSSVLEHFLQNKLKPDRFSVSGYGADKPMQPNDTEEGRRHNRRVEVIIKTMSNIGRYL